MQAALITAYKDREQLRRLVSFLSKGMRVFVHVDRKSPLSDAEIERCGATVLRRYDVGWGSYNHLRAILDMMSMALEDRSVDYLHVLSGQDMPLHPLSWFAEQFDGSREIFAFMTDSANVCFHPSWYERFHLATFFGLDQRKGWVKRFERMSEQLQTRLGIRFGGIGPYTDIYKSLVYISLPVEAARHAVDCFRSDGALRRSLCRCLIPEELFFMTVLKNSRFGGDIKVRDLHYSDWSFRNGSYPAYLDDSDYDKIYDTTGETEFAFARKVDSTLSWGLIAKIAAKIGMEVNPPDGA